jgi:hypothetical protein
MLPPRATAEKLLEDALIKLSSVTSEIMGVSGRDDRGIDQRRA